MTEAKRGGLRARLEEVDGRARAAVLLAGVAGFGAVVAMNRASERHDCGGGSEWKEDALERRIERLERASRAAQHVMDDRDAGW